MKTIIGLLIQVLAYITIVCLHVAMWVGNKRAKEEVEEMREDTHRWMRKMNMVR